MGIGVKVWNILVVSVRMWYQSVCKHPILVGMLCFLIFMYRSFPFLFSLLASASPVLVCTAILLGTLLSFGEPNIPEIEKETVKDDGEEEEINHEISSLKSGLVEDATTVIADRDDSFCIERFLGKKGHTQKENLAVNEISGIEGDDGLGDYMPLFDERSREIQSGNQVTKEVERDFDGFELEQKRKLHQEKPGIKEVLSQEDAVGNKYSLLQNLADKDVEVGDSYSPGESTEVLKYNNLDFPHDSSWNRLNDNDEEEEEGDEVSTSGSDMAESSSPDASMADIIPLLDELHPLLDEEAPQPAHMSHDRSGIASELYHKSKETSLESGDGDGDGGVDDDDDDDDDDDENENENEDENEEEEEEEEEEEGEEEEEDEDEEEEHGEVKEDGYKSAIKWTADDEKNLMDLGTLELERNQRLESLIARRRARRNLRLMAERNLIDFDSSDFPFGIPPISTSRHNPFDLPFDDGPGSAPSILLPRRNPFDLPYDSNEEKPDLKGDSFQQEFSVPQHREAFFRRHESFNVGPSFFGGFKQERQDLRWKPYFVPERFAAEGTGYSTFQRQASEVSESKMSSVPDSESQSSAIDEEDKKLGEVDVFQETEPISNLDHLSVLCQRGNLSSEDVNFADIDQAEKSDVHQDGVEISPGEVEYHHEGDSSLSASEGATPIELNTSEILLRMGPDTEEYSSTSSLSSSSEVDEKIHHVQRGLTSLEATSFQPEVCLISTQNLLDQDLHFVSGVEDDHQQRETVQRETVLVPIEDHIGQITSMQSSGDPDFYSTSEVMVDNENNDSTLGPTGDYKTSLESDLHLLSGLAVDGPEPTVELRGHHIQESSISAQSSLNSDVQFTSVTVDDLHRKEPLYDSSPPSEKFLSFSSISSCTQREISEVSSRVLTEKDPELHTENMVSDAAGYEELLEGSKGHFPLISDSRSRKVAEIGDHCVTRVDANGENEFVSPKSFVEHVSVHSPPSSSDDGSIKEALVSTLESPNLEQELMHPSSLVAETIVEADQDVTVQFNSASFCYQLASEEVDVAAVEDQVPPVVAEDVSAEDKLLDSKGELLKGCADGMEEILGFEQDQVSSSSDADTHVNGRQVVSEKSVLEASRSEFMPSDDLDMFAHKERQPAVLTEEVLEVPSSSTAFHEAENLSFNVEENLEQEELHSSSSGVEIGTVFSLGSSSQHAPSGEKSPLEMKKQMPWSDKSVVEPSFNIQEKWEPSITPAEFTEERRTTNNVNALEVYESEDKMRRIPYLRSDSASVSSESPEYKTPAVGADFRSVFDKIVNEDNGPVFEHSNYEAEAYGSSFAEKINEDEDEIKEIDEELLSELDTVGDFSVKEIVGETLNDGHMPEKTGVGSSKIDLLQNDSSRTQIEPELPVLEFRSAEDVDVAFKQLHEGVNVEEVILPSMVSQQLALNESSCGQTSSELQFIEARSLEDIHVALKKVSEDDIEEETKRLDSKHLQAEGSTVGLTKDVEPRVLEVNEAGSASESTVEMIDNNPIRKHESSTIESDVLASRVTAHESKHGFDEVAGNSSLSMDSIGNEEKSQASNSGDSDRERDL